MYSVIFLHVVSEESKETGEDRALSWCGSLRIWTPRSQGLGPPSYLWHLLEAVDASHTCSDEASLLHLPLDCNGMKWTNRARHLLGFHADSEGVATSTPGCVSLVRGCQCEVRSTFCLILFQRQFSNMSEEAQCLLRLAECCFPGAAFWKVDSR